MGKCTDQEIEPLIYSLTDLLCSSLTISEISTRFYPILWYQQKITNPGHFHFQILNQKASKSMSTKSQKPLQSPQMKPIKPATTVVNFLVLLVTVINFNYQKE